ncbi:glycine betaine ABC transporter substrate-binding protein [Alicyclobacillus curvatus]|nr:glycine betaine ABC transporter substrate-binding protein [Alicyclobacillus curvatus]
MRSRKIGFVLSGAAMLSLLLAGCGSTNTASSSGGNDTSNQTGAAPSTGSKNVTIGYVDWSEDVATSYLWKDLLTQKGYHVTLTSMSDAGPLFAGLSKGGLDVFLDTWLPTTHKHYMQQFGSNLVDLGKWYAGGTKIGFVVPKYVYDSGIHSIADLNAHASEFGNQIVGIDPGAGEMAAAKKVVQDYGLNLNLTASSSAAMLTVLQKDYAAKKPVVVTLWSPHWAFTKYQLKYLSDPKGDFGSAGWIQTEANKTWAGANPTVAGWLKNFKLSPQQLGSLELDINNASSKNAGVQKWIQDNQSLVNTWFK